jgi:hypothetical protein
MRVTNWSGAMGFVLTRGYGRPHRIWTNRRLQQLLQTTMRTPRPLVPTWAWAWRPTNFPKA